MSKADFGTSIGNGNFRPKCDPSIGRPGRIDSINISAKSEVKVKGRTKIKKKIGEKPEIEVEIEITKDFVSL